MKTKDQSAVGRRAFLRGLGFGAVAAGTTVAGTLPGEALADTENYDEKRKARYKADSADVQNYYRVNRYPR
jgi:hypothetical protein